MAKKQEPETLLDLLVIFPAKKLVSFIGRTAVVAGVIGAATHAAHAIGIGGHSTSVAQGSSGATQSQSLNESPIGHMDRTPTGPRPETTGVASSRVPSHELR